MNTHLARVSRASRLQLAVLVDGAERDGTLLGDDARANHARVSAQSTQKSQDHANHANHA
eukprot:2943954-Pleurochrysis_carterae.AAC.1